MNKYIINILILVIFYYPIEVKAQSGFGLTLESAHFKWSKAEVINYRGSCCYEFEKVYNSSGLLFNIINKANQLSFGYSWGGQIVKNNDYGDSEWARNNFYFSFRRYDITNMFPKSQRLSNILRLSPAFTIIYGDGYQDDDAMVQAGFNYNIGLYTHMIKWGDIQPFLGFSVPLNEGIHSWFLSLGLSYNRMLGKDSKDFEDF
ncbi:MAG: hypothetical protein HN994_03905 [Candidatus Marinimicrobia bacterium]|nr:hypothetical protein [Candidatus Neomarinimicrobiota bacterium]